MVLLVRVNMAKMWEMIHNMKVGDLVRVKRTISGDSLEMRKLYHERVLCLLIDDRPPVGDYVYVLALGTRRTIRTSRLELVSESR